MLENTADQLIDAEETEDLPVESPDAEEVEEQLAGQKKQKNKWWRKNRTLMKECPDSCHRQGQYNKKTTIAKEAGIEKIAALVGQDITIVTHKNGSMKGKVIFTYEVLEVNLINDSHLKCGMRDFNTMDYKKREVLVAMFLQLSDWKEKVQKMNEVMEKTSCKCKKFTGEKFLTKLALMIGASEFSQKGVELFSYRDQSPDYDEDFVVWSLISPSPQFEQYKAFLKAFGIFYQQYMLNGSVLMKVCLLGDHRRQL
jgi:hypothetical protein